MTPLMFRQWRSGDLTRPGPMGLPRAARRTPRPSTPTCCSCPFPCFDRRGHRIGFGAGHYDRSLAALRAAGRATAVGVAFGASETAKIPDEPHDQRLDFVLTERELIDCGIG